MFGRKLREIRKQRKITQTELFKITGIPQTTISDFENQKYLPDIEQVKVLAQALKVNILELLEDTA